MNKNVFSQITEDNDTEKEIQKTGQSLKPTNDNSLFAGTTHVRDANSHTIFSNAVLTSQFLREYTDLPIFSNVRPEDIEDVSERYHAFLGVDFEMDTVKKVRVRLNGNDEEVFVIPLIDHKSYVDYDVAMQLFRYMAVIWYDYAKGQNTLKNGISHTKGFRYPLIIPIVYYEGAARWTADTHFCSRIAHAELAQEYVPDFIYKTVHIHSYTNEELQAKHDELSLVMLINKIQSAKDYKDFLATSREFVDSVYEEASDDIQKVIKEILWSLFMKMNVPADEAQKMMKLLEESSMGYLFENMEKMDIQSERQNTNIAREEAKAAKERAEAAEKKAATAEKKAEAAEKEAETVRRNLENSYANLIFKCQKRGFTKEETVTELRDIMNLSDIQAKNKIESYWK